MDDAPLRREASSHIVVALPPFLGGTLVWLRFHKVLSQCHGGLCTAVRSIRRSSSRLTLVPYRQRDNNLLSVSPAVFDMSRG